MTPAQQVARFIASLPDGALVTTDPETAGTVHAAMLATGRRMLLDVFPSRGTGTLRAQWDGPVDGERHDVTTWVTGIGNEPSPDPRKRRGRRPG